MCGLNSIGSDAFILLLISNCMNIPYMLISLKHFF